jgi:hypothetical protein
VRSALRHIGAHFFFLDQSPSGETEIELSIVKGVTGEIRLGGARCDAI